MIIGGREGNAANASQDLYNYSVPVKGEFREAIIKACNKCMGNEDWQKKFVAK